MSQAEAYEVLKSNRNIWMSIPEITVKVSCGRNSLNVNLRKLRGAGLIKYRRISAYPPVIQYKY